MTALVRVTRGVWRPTDTVADFAGKVAAVVAVCPDGTVVAGLSAARLHGLWLPERPDFPIEVAVHPAASVPANHSHSKRAEIRARRRRVPAQEITSVDGILVQTLERTWVDLAETLSLPDLVAAGDCALRAGAGADRLDDAVRRARRRRGVSRARLALPLLNARSRSRPESHLRCAVVLSGLPTPLVNTAITTSLGEWLAEPDLAYEDVRLAMEYNGSDHADVDRMRRDITRELDMTERGGWLTVTFGPRQVFAQTDRIAPLIRRLRRERGARD